MRLATFNVLHGRSTADDQVDLDRFARAVTGLEADVLALQEVDHRQPRSHGGDLTTVAAGAMGAQGACFAPALSGLPGAWKGATGDEPPSSPQYGVALLSRHAFRSSSVVRLPALPGRVPVLFPGRRRPVLVRDEPRVAAVARLDVHGSPLTVVSTHLSFIPWWNVVQLRRLLRALPHTGRLVLMGDLNMAPDRAVRATGLRQLAAGLTFPADAPTEQLDHLLARQVVPRSTGQVHRLAVSDHCALSVDVALDGD